LLAARGPDAATVNLLCCRLRHGLGRAPDRGTWCDGETTALRVLQEGVSRVTA
jgi:hypothetical protein